MGKNDESSIKKAKWAGDLVVLRWVQFFISWHFDFYLCLCRGYSDSFAHRVTQDFLDCDKHAERQG